MKVSLLIRRIFKDDFFFTSIKFLSLFIGFTVVLVILSWVFRELDYDKFWDSEDQIYRIALEQYNNSELQFTKAANYRAVTDLMAEELPEVEARVRLHRDRVTVFTQRAQIQDVNMFYVDTCIFSVLKRTVLSSGSKDLFPDLRSVVISKSLSQKLFGNENPIGSLLSLNEGWKFYVSAVFEDVPENSHISFDLLMTVPSLRYYLSHFNNQTRELDEDPDYEYNDPGPYDKRSWGRWYGYSYIKVKEGTDIDRLAKKAQDLIKSENLPSQMSNSRLKLLFQPISDIHLYSSLGEELGLNGSIKKVYSMLVVALIVIIISIINFVSLSGINFYGKSHSNAIILIHGSSENRIIFNEFVTAISIAMLSALLAVISSGMLSRQIIPGGQINILSLLILLLLIILSGIFILPAIIYCLKSCNIMDLLKKQLIKNSYGKISRELIVFFQFSIAILLISWAIIFYFQMKYVQEKDPGFSSSAVVYSYTPMTMNQSPYLKEKLLVFKDKISKIPGVLSFCTSSSVPGKDFLMQSENVSMNNKTPENKNFYNILNVDENYIDTYKLRIIAGRDFLDNNNYSDNEIIINRTASKKLGVLNPLNALGQMVYVDGNGYEICGVVEDFHHLSLKQQLEPILIFKSLKWRYAVGYYSFKLTGKNVSNSLEQINDIWKGIYPGERFLYSFMEDDYSNLYKSEKSFSRSVIGGSVIAVFIACLGLMSYARYNAFKRIKEIGIRKVFGATNRDILWQFNFEIIRLIIFASILAMPVSFILSKNWLTNFAYRIEIQWWMYILASLIALGIAVTTTFYFSFRSSIRNPVESLRHE